MEKTLNNAFVILLYCFAHGQMLEGEMLYLVENSQLLMQVIDVVKVVSKLKSDFKACCY